MSSSSSASSFFPSPPPSTPSALASALTTALTASAAPSLNSLEFAQRMDAKDELRTLRQEFHIPKHKHGVNGEKKEEEESVYLCGNSLGLCSKSVVTSVTDELSKWSRVGVEGHFTAPREWVRIDDEPQRLLVPVVGAAHVDEIAVANSLSCNLHLLLMTFYKPTPTRYKIVMEEAAFCSDWHVLSSQVQMHGHTIDDGIITLKPKKANDDDDTETLTTDDIIATLNAHGSSVALVLLGGVQFYTGQFFNIPAITAAGHAIGAVVGWDLAHAAGNVPLQLNEWNVDFAAWCSYKYLNSGPGATAGLFVHQRHHADDTKQATLKGWWGQRVNDRFSMGHAHINHAGANSFKLSNPPVLPVVCLHSSLLLFEQAGSLPALRRKSVMLTGYLETLLKLVITDSHPKVVRQITPTNPAERGAQLSLKFSFPVRALCARLHEVHGMTVDAREPNVIRISPTPLYNSFVDVYKCVHKLHDAMKALKHI